jgi:hypothetical protein
VNRIEVWHDDTSDPGNPLYCVSLCEDDGEEIKCLSTHERRADAEIAGRGAAEKRNLKAIFRGIRGTNEL